MPPPTPHLEHLILNLQIRLNPKTRSVELKTSETTDDPGAIQKGQDFVEAFMMGSEMQDAVGTAARSSPRWAARIHHLLTRKARPQEYQLARTERQFEENIINL